MKMNTVIITVELDYENLYDEPIKNFIGELVKVKSGLYENIATGIITDVKEKTIPRKLERKK